MRDIIIIGGGPAGLAAGLYAARAGRDCLLIESMFSGGQITKTSLVENYPGFDEGVDGFALAAKMEAQAVRFGLEIQNHTVTGLDIGGQIKHVFCEDTEFKAKAVILATGASPRVLGVPGEAEFTGNGVSYCATCDGAFFREKPVAVVGGGDTALSDALYLSRFAKKVYLVHRRGEFRGVKALQDAVRADEKIELVLAVPVAIEGSQSVEGLRVLNKHTEAESLLEVSGIFVAVGISPNTELVDGVVQLDSQGYIITNERMETSMRGVYAAGDMRATPLRQVITAAADGAVAATSAVEYLML